MNGDREQAYAWHRSGNLAGAEKLYRQLLAAWPGDLDTAHYLAVLLTQTGRDEAALVLLRDLLKRAPMRTESWLVCAMVCRRLGRNDEGLRAAATAVQQNPRDGVGLSMLGSLQVKSGDFHGGETTLRRALAIDSRTVEGWQSLGIALVRQNRWQEAIAAYRCALTLSAGDASIHYNIGLCAEAMGDLPTALAEYSAVLQSTPHRLDAHARSANVQALLCDFAGEARSVAVMEQLLATPERLQPNDQAAPFVLMFLPLSARSRRQILRSYVEKVARDSASLRPPPRRPEVAETSRPLRIGYLSPDFGDHAVGTLVQDMFAAHDRNLVSVYGYSLTSYSGQVADTIRAGCDVFREAHALSTQALAETIAADRIDVLVDLGGFTLGTRPEVLALRPAPVQMGYLGFLHGMDAPWMDYIVLDGQVAPRGSEQLFSEAVIRLPGTLLPAPRNLETGTADRRRFNLPEDVPLFGSFNNSYKWDAEFQQACVEISRRLPDARFVLYLPELAQPRFLQSWRERGGNADALLFVQKIAPADHADRAASCDLFLDTFRYHAGATGIAALAAGLPVLCREGVLPTARMGVSLNRFLGLDDLICPDTATYIERAVHWGSRGTGELKRQLAEAVRTRGLLDPSRVARGLESAFREAWSRRQNGLPAQHIDLS
jgi:predicted O-linked N-acetylglucosamine transferase (SPINDLY family)